MHAIDKLTCPRIDLLYMVLLFRPASAIQSSALVYPAPPTRLLYAVHTPIDRSPRTFSSIYNAYRDLNAAAMRTYDAIPSYSTPYLPIAG